MIKTIYICSKCSTESSKWTGKCLQCGGWNTLVEDAVDTKAFKEIEAKTIEVSKVSLEDAFALRWQTGLEEFDRVVGGGMVQGSLTLLSGDPGIGKSTLALQVGLKLAEQKKKVLYVSGEESVQQLSMRARRLQSGDIPESFSLVSSNHLESVVATIGKFKPDLVIADSVQTFVAESMSGGAGSMVQIRHIAECCMTLAKQGGISVLLIGHVTKDGDLAGPKVLEHLVDTVLYFEGEKYHELRILRAMKNRFGATTEVGVFEMNGEGLREVANPSEVFLKGRKKNAIGSSISVTMEGSRPFVLEVQALTNKADYTYPKRAAAGVENNRVQLLAAVLNKHARLKLEDQDLYVNIAGGFRVQDPGIDLAIAASVMSSRRDTPLPEASAFLGEIGLSGEVRPVAQEERRLKELEKLGFKTVYGNIVDGKKCKMKVVQVDEVRKLFEK
ncbi:MAG: DNA repair protein RadA [bacterium]|nr:DNA repair protein RadA [bacterium]